MKCKSYLFTSIQAVLAALQKHFVVPVLPVSLLQCKMFPLKVYSDSSDLLALSVHSPFPSTFTFSSSPTTMLLHGTCPGYWC